MFSVLMSLYDKEDPVFLNLCLESIKNQTLLPDEIVLVYDGKIKIELDKVVDYYTKFLPITKIKLDSNQGLGKALQIGLQHCKYNIVARMDTDDICHPQRFEIQIPKISMDEELVLLGSAITEFDADNNERLKKLPLSQSNIAEYAKLKNPFNHMTVVFRKEIIIKLGGYVHHLYMEDYNLWLRVLSKKYKVENIPDTLVRARVGKSMVIKRRGVKYIKSEIQLMQLKYKLGINNFIGNFFCFIIRAVPRILPSAVLSYIYNVDRKSKNV